MALNNNKQSNLEKKGIEQRQIELIRSDYNKIDAYSESHEDALSNPADETKAQGKGTGNGGHQAYVPDASQPSTLFNYSSLDTSAGGGAYDIHGRNNQGGRNRLLKINIYNKDNAYGPNSVDTSANINEGQYVIKG
jgi:hypothetical protein